MLRHPTELAVHPAERMPRNCVKGSSPPLAGSRSTRAGLASGSLEPVPRRSGRELGVSFVSLTEAMGLTTPASRAMAGLLSVFAGFEHEILRERIRAAIAEARLRNQSRPTRDCWKTRHPDPKLAPFATER